MDELSRWYENMTYQEAKDILREKLDYMKKNFIAAGYYMKYIRDHELFREDGYESIWEFAEDNYGIKKSTASRWMSMNDKFSQGGNSPILAEEFRDFEKSQLQEMLYLDDKQIESVTPDMTVKEIREVRKPADRQRELKKPDETDREYLNAAAKKLIKSLRKWFLRDYTNRVLLVDKSPEEIKRELGKDHRYWYFPTENGLASINLFDDYVQIWDENYECIGEFEWFYLAAAIQAMWNNVSLEMAQEVQISESEEKNKPDRQRMYYRKKPERELCLLWKGQCDDDCNSRCGWIDSAVATSQQQEEPAPVLDMNPPEEISEPEPEVVAEENVEVVDAAEEESVEELYEETSDQSDIDLLREELNKANGNLKLMLSCYSEKDIRVRKQKLLVGALAGMLCDLDTVDIPEQQPELPIFKNNDQRKAWLRDYKAWGLWYEDENIGARYYKYDFENGARLIAEEYTRPATEWYGEHMISFLHLVGGPEPPKDKTGCVSKWQRHEVYDRFQNNETELVEFLKYVQKRGGANE